MAVLLVLCAPEAQAEKRRRGARDQVDFGVEMAQRGLWSEALFRFRQAERLQGENTAVLNNLAVTHEALGNFEEALSYYQKALRLEPSNRSLKRNYSRFVEFYQSFKPKEEEASDEAEGEGQAPVTADASAEGEG